MWVVRGEGYKVAQWSWGENVREDMLMQVSLTDATREPLQAGVLSYVRNTTPNT